MLDRPFEVVCTKNSKKGFLGLTMSRQQLGDLERDSMALNELMEEELQWGFQLQKALTRQEAMVQQTNHEDAAFLAWNVFADLSNMAISLTLVGEHGLAAQHLRKQAFTGYPRIVDWRRELGQERLRKYLRAV